MKTLSNLQRMLESFTPIEEHAAAIQLKDKELRQMRDLIKAVEKYAEFRALSKGMLDKNKNNGVSNPTTSASKTLHLRSAPKNDLGRYAMTEEEVTAFRYGGIAGPFTVLSPSEATDLRGYLLNQYQNDFDGKSVFPDEIKAIFKRNNAWKINAAGLYHALFDPRLREVYCRPEITDKLASLIGNDILCWRTQCFESAPGNPGTFWHQTAAFREHGKRQKLVPTTIDIDDNMIQLTVWIALEDVSIKNSCLRFLRGSFIDGALEKFSHDMFDDLVGFLHDKPKEVVDQVLRIMLFQSNIFTKWQMAFHEFTRLHPNYFEDYELVDMEMKAGQFVIFSSANMHSSTANSTNVPRMALAGRYTSNDVKVLPNMDYEPLSTPEGLVQWPLDRTACFQARGEDRFGHNRIAPAFEKILN